MLSQKVEASNPLASELSGYIGSEVNRLNSLVTRFLDFARPRASNCTPSSRRPSWTTFSNPSKINIPTPRDRGARLRSATPDVQVDAQLCEQIFANLITNAYQAMDGNGRLRIAITPETHNMRRGVAVMIEDSGPGVPAESREQIFNRFFTSKKTA